MCGGARALSRTCAKACAGKRRASLAPGCSEIVKSRSLKSEIAKPARRVLEAQARRGLLRQRILQKIAQRAGRTLIPVSSCRDICRPSVETALPALRRVCPRTLRRILSPGPSALERLISRSIGPGWRDSRLRALSREVHCHTTKRVSLARRDRRHPLRARPPVTGLFNRSPAVA